MIPFRLANEMEGGDNRGKNQQEQKGCSGQTAYAEKAGQPQKSSDSPP